MVAEDTPELVSSRPAWIHGPLNVEPDYFASNRRYYFRAIPEFKARAEFGSPRKY